MWCSSSSLQDRSTVAVTIQALLVFCTQCSDIGSFFVHRLDCPTRSLQPGKWQSFFLISQTMRQWDRSQNCKLQCRLSWGMPQPIIYQLARHWGHPTPAASKQINVIFPQMKFSYQHNKIKPHLHAIQKNRYASPGFAMKVIISRALSKTQPSVCYCTHHQSVRFNRV